MSESLWPHGMQHARLPCPSLSPRVCSNSSPLSQWCHPTISSSCPHLLLLSIFPSIMIFSNKSDLPIRWPKYWSFCFTISPSNEYLGWISFRIYGFNLYLPQNNILKATILCHSAFLMVQLSHSYLITGNTIALTIWMFVSKMMSLLFNMLSRFVNCYCPIYGLPR